MAFLGDSVWRATGFAVAARERSKHFIDMGAYFPTREVLAADVAFQFPDGKRLALPPSYVWNGEQRSSQTLLEETGTTGLLVIVDDEVRFEQYDLGLTREGRWISWSMSKSFASALIGIAIAEGSITSVEEAVTDYVPELAESAYDGVRPEDVLQMLSGVRWNEDYSDPESDINRWDFGLAFGEVSPRAHSAASPADGLHRVPSHCSPS
jgi:CubicO group peptidase (beta-lactamase class C family)